MIYIISFTIYENMMFIILKYLITAGVIVTVSEIAKAYDRIGALLVSLPLITILTLIWLHIEKAWVDKIWNHAYYTFWYVIPTLPMFLVFPFLLRKFSFWTSLWISVLWTIIIFLVFAWFLKKFWIHLI